MNDKGRADKSSINLLIEMREMAQSNIAVLKALIAWQGALVRFNDALAAANTQDTATASALSQQDTAESSLPHKTK